MNLLVSHVRFGMPVLDAIHACGVEVLDDMLQTVAMVFVGGRIRLGEFDTCKSNICMACCHGPYQFTNSCSVVYLHGFGKGFLFVWIVGAKCGVEFLEPNGACWEWEWFGFCDRCVAEPSIDVLLTEYVDVCVAVNFDVVSCLCDINAILYINESLTFERDAEVVFDEVQ